METRAVTSQDQRIDYVPDDGELSFEQLCSAFVRDLLPASVRNFGKLPRIGKLVRLVSSPVTVVHTDKTKRLVAFQYTRFSPLYYPDEVVRVYNTHLRLESRAARRSKELTYSEIVDRITKRGLDELGSLTDKTAIPMLQVERFGEGFYAAVWNAQNVLDYDSGARRELVIDEPTVTIGGTRTLPELHLAFHRMPQYIVDGEKEDTSKIYDQLEISFPELTERQNAGIRQARSLNLEWAQTDLDKPLELRQSRVIHSATNVHYTMKFIRDYLKKHYLG